MSARMMQGDCPKGYKQTEVGVIPEDWGVSNLVNLIDPSRAIRYGIVQPGKFDPRGRYMVRGQDYSSNWADPSELFRVSSSIEERYANARIKAGDVLITIVGASTGRVAVAPEWLDGANLTQTTARIAINNSKADSSYCRFVLSSWYGVRQVQNYIKGGAQPGLNCGDIEKFLIPLPPTKAEQEAIAEALSDADALIESLEHLIAKKRQVKQGAMQELLTGKRRLPGFSGEWEVKRLGEVALARKDRVDPRRSGPHEFCIELEHIGQGTGCLVGFTTTSELSSFKSIFQEGDILFGKLRAYLRKYWLANQQGVCSTEIWVLVAKRSVVTPGFLYQHVTLDRFIEVASTAYGTHMPRSDWNVVKNHEIQLPPIPEQTAIAAILSDMDAEIAELEAKLAKARQVKQGMMQELLTGRIRLV